MPVAGNRGASFLSRGSAPGVWLEVDDDLACLSRVEEPDRLLYLRKGETMRDHGLQIYVLLLEQIEDREMMEEPKSVSSLLIAV